MPVLTVVMPVHGVERFLRRCLDSILFEPVGGIDVIAVDDCSPDRCGEILDQYAARDSRLNVIHLPQNAGVSQARNIGLERARGEYVWFVDPDDWLPEGSLQAVLDRISDTRPDVLIVDHVEVFDRDGRVRHTTGVGVLGSREPTTLAQRPELLTLMHSACTKIVRRRFLDEIDLRFQPGWYEDAAYSHPVLLGAQRIDTLDRVCYSYRQRVSGGITKSVTTRHFDVFDQYRRMFAVVDRMLGPGHEFQPMLFRLMVDHYLVIAGNDQRLSPDTRRDFFQRAAADFRARLPRQGYPVPGGIEGVKHRLLRHNAYPAYAAMRSVYRLAGGRKVLRAGQVPPQPSPIELVAANEARPARQP